MDSLKPLSRFCTRIAASSAALSAFGVILVVLTAVPAGAAAPSRKAAVEVESTRPGTSARPHNGLRVTQFTHSSPSTNLYGGSIVIADPALAAYEQLAPPIEDLRKYLGE